MGARTAGLYGGTRGRETVITQTSTQLFRASRSLFSPAPVVVLQLVGVLTRLVTGDEELPATGPRSRGRVRVSRRCRASAPWLLRPVLLKQLLAPVDARMTAMRFLGLAWPR